MQENNLSHFLSEIREGKRVEVLMEMDTKRLSVDMRASSIFEADPAGNRLILSQTDPPITSSLEGSDLEILFVTGPLECDMDSNEGPIRCGFKSRFFRVDTKYTLKGGQRVPALFFSFPHHIYQKNVRFCLRVKPFIRHNILAEVYERGHKKFGENQVTVVNISTGGIQVSFKRMMGPEVNLNEDVLIWLSLWNGRSLYVNGTIVWMRPHGKRPDIQLMGIKFVGLGPDDEDILGDCVRYLERLELKRRSRL